MIVRENPDGLSTSYIVEGCDSDFLNKLPTHLAYIRAFFHNQALGLDNTLEQLKAIEHFLATNRKVAELHTSAFFHGLVAYCGELLRVEISGEWKMVVSKAGVHYAKDRYFPSITDAAGQEYAFSASLEDELAALLRPELNRDKMNGLYYAIQFQLHSRIKLPVQKVTSWFFPPLNDEAVG